MSDEKDFENKGGKNAFIFSMVFSIGFIIAISFLHPGVKLDEVKKDALRKAAKDLANNEGDAGAGFDISTVAEADLWKSSEGLISHGKKAYRTNCAVCHGNTGKGDGPAGAALKPPPRNLIEGKWTVGGDSISLYKTLEVGIPGTSMAAFAHVSKADRWAMVHYIRSITKDKPKDDEAKLAEFAKTAK